MSFQAAFTADNKAVYAFGIYIYGKGIILATSGLKCLLLGSVQLSGGLTILTNNPIPLEAGIPLHI